MAPEIALQWRILGTIHDRSRRISEMPRLGFPALLLVSVLTALVACNTAPQQASQPTAAPDTRAADEAAIRALDADWVKAVADKDATKTASFYADDASVFPPAGPMAVGKDAIQKMFTALMAEPGFALTFTPVKVEVSRSGDLASEIGDYVFTYNGPKGKLLTAKSKYVVVWTRQPGGSWKVIVDAPTTAIP